MSAVVTGGGSGIGRAVVGLLRAAGHDAVAWDLRDGDIDCDISDPDAVAAAMRITIAEHGAPDRVVACAGVGASGSSISGTVADDHMGAYCVSKAGVDMLVKVAAVEWGRYGIRVNAVGPGVTRTPMLATPEQLPGWVEAIGDRTPLSQVGEAGDVAAAIVATLELGWVTGQVIHADGGLALHSPIAAFGHGQLRKNS